MLFLRPLLVFFILLCTISMHAFAGEKQDKAYRTFWHPKYHGQRLNYCTLNGKECGLAVANQFCKKLGYNYASQEILAPNIGLTHFIDNKAVCKGWQCNGFMTIGCAQYLSHTPPKNYHYRKKHFAYPRVNHYRIDWCYKKSQGCGARAANAFCMIMGYTQATKFIQETNIKATKTIGNQALCFGNTCKAFKYIDCYR